MKNHTYTSSFIIFALVLIAVDCKKDFYNLTPAPFKGQQTCVFINKFFTKTNQATLKLEFETRKNPKRDPKDMNSVKFKMMILDQFGYKSIKES
jgi:Rhodopsin-like GPCR transmembrane domain